MADLQKRNLFDSNVTKLESLAGTDLFPVERNGVIAAIAAGNASFAGSATYGDIADMKADASLIVGQIVSTSGYDRPGDQGHGRYQIVEAATGTEDGGSYIDLPASGFQAKLLHGAIIWAEQFGVVLDANGKAQERSAQFNAAFAYAASLPDTYSGDDAEDVEAIVTGGYDFNCLTDFTAKDTLVLMDGSASARAMNINWSGHVIAVAGGTLANHTHERPIPLVHFRLRSCKVYWPRFECEMICAGIKGKVDLANEHYNLELRGFHRYGLWIVSSNDSTWWDFIIKQFIRDPLWIRNGVDTTDWTEWNGDCIVVTTKDRRFIGGQVGWGGPCVRVTDSMPDNAAQRIPGQNCYWCGLSSTQGYVDGDNGGGDDVFNDIHMMQGLSNGDFLDASIAPRYGVYADYDLGTGQMVFREVDSPIGLLSYCKVSNLSKFTQVDNDQCIHLLFGAQIEFEGELPGSQASPLSLSTSTGTLLDPRIRVFANRNAAGSQRYPFMSSMKHQRQMTIAFYDNPVEIYWNGSALVEASTSWNGNFDEWNRLNRASGSYAGQVQYRGRRSTAGAWSPSVTAAGDYWVIHAAVTVNPGSVAAADGQILYALTASPAGSGDWLVVDADSAPVRQTSRFETNVLPHIYNLYPAQHGGSPQVYDYTPDAVFERRMKTAGLQATLTLEDAADTLRVGTTASAVVAGKPFVYDQFTTRAAMVTWITSHADEVPTNGILSVKDGLIWQKVTSSSAISDMPNFVPVGDVYPDHFAANTTPGTTDMGAAILAALAYSDVVYLRGTSYATSVEIKWNNKRLQGASAHTSKIIGLSASLAVGTPIVTPGRSASVSDVWIAYDSLTGTEAQDERVGLNVGGDLPATFVFQRAGMIERVIINNCGTGIGDLGRGVFSASFDGIEIKAHSYAGIDIRGTSRTGNLWGSIYVNGSDAYEAVYGINIAGQEAGGSMGQINVEHNVYSGSAVRFKGCHGLQIASLHIEGVDTSAAGKSYIEVDEALVDIGVLSIVNTRMNYDSTRLVEFKEADYVDVGTYSADAVTSGLSVRTYHLKGLAAPDAGLYPSYPSGRRGLNNVAGFAHFYRDSAYSDRNMVLDVGRYTFATYSGQSDGEFYKYADSRHLSGKIRVARFDGRGEENHPRQNYVGNAAFDTWASTSLSGVTTATELADGWYLEATTGTIAGSQETDDYGLDNRYFLRFDTTGTAGNFQRLYHDITDFHELLDRRLTLSFDMKAGSAGRVLEQITCPLFTDSGTPASVTKQVISGLSATLDATTSWQNYRFSFDSVTSASVSAFGANPYFRLSFQINDASGTRQSQVDIRRVKLEAGPGGTDFIRRRGVA